MQPARRRLYSSFVLAVAGGVAACGSHPDPESRATPTTTAIRADSAAFVTRLGDDTLVVERMARTPTSVVTDVLLRVPTTTRTRWVMELSPTGEMTRLASTPLDPVTGAPRAPGPTQLVTRFGDSLRIETSGEQGTRVTTVAAPAATLPFIDMVHWPYEVVLMRARAMSVDTVRQPLLTGTRVSTFRIGRVGGDSMTITHPSRGTMRVRVDDEGRLLGLDAGATTRALVVERRPWMRVEQLADRWVDADAAGRSAGALSGRDTTRAIIDGASLLVEYGTPAKRGRDIWGALVRYGQVWRTGANMATHFTTSRDLLLGTGADTLRVPAGSYTLFSIPEADGGVLIVSRQTGQTGTAYDPARDLGRVRMQARSLSAPVETFAIGLTADDETGAIRLRWDMQERVVPFVVR